jgi:hypothetical protein
MGRAVTVTRDDGTPLRLALRTTRQASYAFTSAQLADLGNQTGIAAAEALIGAWEDPADFRLQAAGVTGVSAGDVALCRGVTCPKSGESCISGSCTTLEAARARHSAALSGGSSSASDAGEKKGMATWLIGAIVGGAVVLLAGVALVVVKLRGGSSDSGGGGGGGKDNFRHGEFSDVSAANRQRPRDAGDDPFSLPPAGGSAPPPPPPRQQGGY